MIFEAANLLVLIVTATIVAWYTHETKKLRVEAQKQTELQLRPFVIFEATRECFQVRNIGNGTAINVRVADIRLIDNPSMPLSAHFSEPVPALTGGQCLPMPRGQALVLSGGGFERAQQRVGDNWLDILKPLQSSIAKPVKIDFRPEIRIEFQDVERQWYFVEERLIYGELEIIDSGKRH